MHLVIRYDLRSAPFGQPHHVQYGAMLEQARWADRQGLDSIVFSEHHAADDGYLPSPIVAAAAAAGATRDIRVSLAAVLLPLYDVVRLSEDLAVLDLVSGGRLDVVIGAGYRREEFELHDRTYKGRFGVLERGVDVLRKAWTGEPFEHEGRTVRITPAPHQPGGPKLFLGGASVGAAERAARIADGFMPVTDALEQAYYASCEALGKPPGPAVGARPPMFVHVSDDPDRAWHTIAPYALHESNSYGQWLNDAGNLGPYSPAGDAAALRREGNYVVLTPDECVDFAIERGGLTLHPLMGGLDPAIAEESLALIESSVLPRLRNDTASAP